MKVFRLFSLIFALTAFTAHASQNKEHEMPPIKTPKSFDQLKQLVGEWEGKTKQGDKEETIKVTYELTSGGTAIIEKLFPGTPHEMVSVYAANGDKVSMTHYCMMGNQPQLTLKKETPNSLSFEMKGTSGLRNAKDPHMHSVTLTFLSPTKLKQEWTSYQNNKKQESSIFEFEKD